jgi:hypothetical protein
MAMSMGRGSRVCAVVALASLILGTALTLASCGGASTAATSPPAASTAASPASGGGAAWLAAQAAIKKVAGDAALVGMGTGRIAALTEVSDAWAFTFFSPDANQLYAVSVRSGVAQTRRLSS